MSLYISRLGLCAILGAAVGIGCSAESDPSATSDPVDVAESSAEVRRCRPTTCSAQGKTCGTISNGCGGTLDCGTCAAGMACGTSNVCVQTCSPTTCQALGKTCGQYPNGCGGTLDCGACPSCPAIVATGSFAPSGNSFSELDYAFQAKNPIIAVAASGNTLTLTSRNGDTGTITLQNTSVSGAFASLPQYGLNMVYTSGSQLGLSGLDAYQWLTFSNATVSAPFNGFQFLDPIFFGPSFVTSVTGSGDKLIFTDVFGATGTVTLTCQ